MARSRLLAAAGAFLLLGLSAAAATRLSGPPSCDATVDDCALALRLAALRETGPAAMAASFGAALLSAGIALMGTPPRAFRPVAMLLGGAVLSFSAAAFVLRLGDHVERTARGAMVVATPGFDVWSYRLMLLALALAFAAVLLAFALQAREPAGPARQARG